MSPVNHSSLFSVVYTFGTGTVNSETFFQSATGDTEGPEYSYQYARNSTVTQNQFLRTVNGITPTSTYGPLIPHDSKIVWITFSMSGSAHQGQAFRIWNNGTNVFAADFPDSTASPYAISKDVDIDQGNLSVEIYDQAAGPYTGLHRPICHVGIRWRM